MCKDKVLACAALYGDPDGCVYNDKSKTLERNGNKTCGLTSLLNFVNTVDSVKVAEGCEKSLTDYAKELCTPTEEGGHEYPWKCRMRGIGAWTEIANSEDYNKVDTTTLYGMFQMRARDFCGDELLTGSNNAQSNEPDTKLKASIANSKGIIEKIVEDIKINLAIQARDECESKDDVQSGKKGINGVWIDNELVGTMLASKVDSKSYNSEFYGRFFGGSYDSASYGYGFCAANTTMTQCLAQNIDPDKNLAEYDSATGECKFKEDWYNEKTLSIGGYVEDGVYYVMDN